MATTHSDRPRVSVVVGSDGQDGHYLCELLLGRGGHVVGIGRRDCTSSRDGRRGPVDIRSRDQVAALLAELRPDEIYYLAGVFNSSEDPLEEPRETFDHSHAVHVTGWLNFLDGVERHKLGTRLFYAASSRVFGDPSESPQTERTPLAPVCIYGMTKACGLQLARFYRRSRGLACSVGILYNHESPRRPPGFVSRKIVQAAVDIKLGAKRILKLGKLSATVDWGAVQDYVDAIARIQQLKRADDFIIASGKPHTVQDFAEQAFLAAGLPWEPYVAEDPSLIGAAPAALPLIGDASRLRAATGWKPTMDFAGMVRRLVAEELRSRQVT
jgi:GDPmannose 4,6-dehydratase